MRLTEDQHSVLHTLEKLGPSTAQKLYQKCWPLCPRAVRRALLVLQAHGLAETAYVRWDAELARVLYLITENGYIRLNRGID